MLVTPLSSTIIRVLVFIKVAYEPLNNKTIFLINFDTLATIT